MSITRQELLSHLTQEWQQEVNPDDGEYSLVTRDWIRRNLCIAMDTTCQSLGIWYQDNRWDCEDYAALFMMLAKLRKDAHRSLAIGWLYYTIEGRGNHAINFAVVREQGKLVTVYIEPQPSAHIIMLSPAEVASIYRNKI